MSWSLALEITRVSFLAPSTSSVFRTSRNSVIRTWLHSIWDTNKKLIWNRRSRRLSSTMLWIIWCDSLSTLKASRSTMYSFSRCSTSNGRSKYSPSPATSLNPYQNHFALPRVTSDVVVHLFRVSTWCDVHEMDAITSLYRALGFVEIVFHSSKIFEILK
jgi:hypothetical protein